MALHLMSGTRLEAEYGACAAVQVGARAFLSAQVAPDGDAAAQSGRVFRQMSDLLSAIHLSPLEVVKTRVFYANSVDLPAITRAHNTAFASAIPASTFVQATCLPFGALVAVEAEARQAAPSARKSFASDGGVTVQVGDEVWLSGVDARRPDGSIHFPRDARAQAAYIAKALTRRLQECGATPADIVSTRTYAPKAYYDADTLPERKPFMAPGNPTAAGIWMEGLGDPGLTLLIDVEAIVGAATRRHNVRTGRAYEVEHCYSRSVRVGAVVYVSGSTSMNLDEQPDWPHNARMQALQALGVIRYGIEQQGLPFTDIVRTRSYVVGEGNLAAVAQALRETLGNICPAATVVGVPVLGRPETVVEIEATAVANAGKRQ